MSLPPDFGVPPALAATPAAASDYAYCTDLVRAQDRDRFLAALFAPADKRQDLFALYAFNVEVARVREVVREALPGEVRLQWWRELIEGHGRGEVGGHPVASALLGTIGRYSLPRGALLNLIEARVFDLYDDPMPSMNDLEGYAGETASALLQLSAHILGGGPRPALANACGHGGVAIALTGLMRALPVHAARGQCFLPLDVLKRHGSSRDEVVARKPTPGILATLADLRTQAARHLAEAEKALVGLDPALAPAFLTLALVPGDLKALERLRDPFARVGGLSALRRQWTLWRASARTR
ncbi:phytoene synthase [Azorhizobium sp. AG788]|uniref:phytoene/squalene synthase family protein n=1 Tax=Azorhizobium sp. AG788 TaxID=2183897 RepID=UPI00105B450E|nr:phytoene/squalene synthase family protein [Azorhizobium sp. AG788]TDT90390.1 phytoene synthase [Azorhizobium sp. AG788]